MLFSSLTENFTVIKCAGSPASWKLKKLLMGLWFFYLRWNIDFMTFC